MNKKDIKELQKQLPELPTYNCVCMGCGHEWKSKEEAYCLTTSCPKCNCPDIYYEEDEK